MTEDLSNSDVTTKYQEAAKIANLALQGVVQQSVVGARVNDLCKFGDTVIEQVHVQHMRVLLLLLLQSRMEDGNLWKTLFYRLLCCSIKHTTRYLDVESFAGFFSSVVSFLQGHVRRYNCSTLQRCKSAPIYLQALLYRVKWMRFRQQSIHPSMNLDLCLEDEDLQYVQRMTR